MPVLSLAENAAISATKIVNDLQHPATAAPYAHIGDQQMEAIQKLAENFQRATIQSQPDQPQSPASLPTPTPKPKAVHLRQHPRVASPRATTVTTVEHVTRVPKAPREAKIPPSHVLPGPKLVPISEALPHLIPPDIQPSTPGANSPPAHVVAQPQTLLPKKPLTRPPLQLSPQTPFPLTKNITLFRPPNLIPPNTPRYPFRQRRHQQTTLIRARYANAATFHDFFQANSVIQPITGALQEFLHLILGPDKATWS